LSFTQTKYKFDFSLQFRGLQLCVGYSVQHVLWPEKICES